MDGAGVKTDMQAGTRFAPRSSSVQTLAWLGELFTSIYGTGRMGLCVNFSPREDWLRLDRQMYSYSDSISLSYGHKKLLSHFDMMRAEWVY